MPGDCQATRCPPVPGMHVVRSVAAYAIQLEARSRLCNSGYYELRLVSCDFHQGVLTLRGSVSSFYLKQVAQTLIREVGGVGELHNDLDVVSPFGQTGEVPCLGPLQSRNDS